MLVTNRETIAQDVMDDGSLGFSSQGRVPFRNGELRKASSWQKTLVFRRLDFSLFREFLCRTLWS